MINIFELQSQAQAPMAIAHSYVFLSRIDHKTKTEDFCKSPGLVHCTGVYHVHMDFFKNSTANICGHLSAFKQAQQCPKNMSFG